MNRFEYAEARLKLNELFLKREKAVKLYDGDAKVIERKSFLEKRKKRNTI